VNPAPHATVAPPPDPRPGPRPHPWSVAFYRVLLELNYRRQRTHFWARFLKKLIPALLLVFLIDFNARHFRDMVGRLNAWWGTARTRMEMGEMAGALDAEYASTDRYPAPEAFRDFVRHWVRPNSTHDPYYDRWHHAYRYRVDGARYEILSCGPDGECGTDDDVRRPGGFATIQPPP
jgi:type II secretion system (T2SS) protein G